MFCVILPLQSDSDDVPLVRRKPAPAKAAESDEDKPLKKAMPKKAVKAEDSDDEPLSARRAKPEPQSDEDGDDFEDEKPAKKKVHCLSVVCASIPLANGGLLMLLAFAGTGQNTISIQAQGSAQDFLISQAESTNGEGRRWRGGEE